MADINKSGKINVKKKKNNSVGELLSWLKTIAIAVIVTLLISNFVIVNATVPTGSMENTIMPKDRIVAFRLAYLFDTPKRGDVVIFEPPDGADDPYVKRVIGLPGEVIRIADGTVYINDTPLEEPYLPEPMVGEFGPFEIPEDSYFMMGDNRNDSYDARYWHNKFVDRSEIMGKVIFKYFPSIGLVK